MCNISYPTPIESHRDHLLLHRGQTARIGIVPQKPPATPVTLLAAKSFFAGIRLAILHYGFTLTMRTLDGCLCHRLVLLQAVCSPSSLSSTDWRHYPKSLLQCHCSCP